jgi:hypothetical protein
MRVRDWREILEDVILAGDGIGRGAVTRVAVRRGLIRRDAVVAP